MYDTDPETKKHFEGLNLPELILSTGEIVPCGEPEQKIENCCHCYGMSQQLTQEQTNNDKLKHQLKEKDVEIEQLNEVINFQQIKIGKFEDVTSDFECAIENINNL